MVNINIKEAKKVKATESAFVDFAYDVELIDQIKTLPMRYWHPAQKQWEIEIASIPNVIKFAGNRAITLTGQNKLYVPILQQNNISQNELPSSLNKILKTKMMQHQIEAALYGINNNSMLLGDEAGLGKTLSTIAAALVKRELNQYKHTLIICGVNGLKWNWANEIKKHTTEEPYIIGQRINSRTGKLTIGGIKEKMEDLKKLPKNYFLITNIESLRNDKIVTALKHWCEKGQINLVAIDESHKISNGQAAQTKGFLQLQSESRMALTGTPMLNKPLDLWVPLHWLGAERHSFYQFRKHYAVMGGYGGYEIVDYKNLDQLQEDLNKVMLRRLKKDVLDLPEKIITTEFVQMDKDQAAIYREVYNEIAENIDKVLLSPNPLTEMLRLRQVTSNPKIVTSLSISCAKLDRLDDLLRERIEAGNKVLVISNWTSVTDDLLIRYKEFNPATITGKVKDADRMKEQDKLNHDPNCKMLIGTIGSMGTGLTLTGANTVIFVDEPWHYAALEQASDRIHRIGMGNSAEIIILLTKDTIDERIHELISEKKELSDYVIDGKAMGKKQDLIKFLMS